MSLAGTINSLYSSLQGNLVIIGIIYLISIALLKRFSIVIIGINIGVIGLFFMNSPMILAVIAGAVSILQGIYLLYKKELRTGLKNLSFGYFFILMAIPDSPSVIAAGMVLLLSIKFLAVSMEHEISDRVLYFSDIIIAAVAVLKFQPHIADAGLLSALIMALIALCIIRFLVSSQINTMLYILPQFLCAGVFVPPVYMTLAVIYIFLINALSTEKNKAMRMLDLLPYVDSTLFTSIIYALLNKYGYKYGLAAGTAIFVLFLLSSFKSFEKYFREKKHQQWSNITILLFVSSILVVFIPPIMEGKFVLYKPVPVFPFILLVLIEARYVSVFNRINFSSFNAWVLNALKFIYGTLEIVSVSILKILSRISLFGGKVVKGITLYFTHIVGIVPRLFNLYVNRKPGSRTYKNIYVLVRKVELYFSEKLKLEDLISIVIILILLMYYLGDF